MTVFWASIGIYFVFVGVVLLAYARRVGPEGVAVPVVGRVGRSAMTAAGLAAAFGGYHVVAYLGPAGWIALAVRRDLWWLVPIGCVAVVVGSVASERWLGADEGNRDETRTDRGAGASS